MVNSSVKGKCFERDVSKIMGKVTGHEHFRSPQSGGMSTNHSLNNFVGDVIPKIVFENKERQSYVVECKSVAKLNIQDIYNPTSLFYSYIKQTEEESEKINVFWYLFIKVNRKGIYLLMKEDTNELLDVLFCYICKNKTCLKLHTEKNIYKIYKIE